MQANDRIGRRLKLRELNIFLTVAKERSMSKAATELAISQPAVSRAIADMEYTLGVPLLDRNPHGVEPTLYGRSLIKRSIVVFDELRQSVKEIEFLADPSAGEIRIGCTAPLAAGIVLAIIERLNRRYPRILIQVVHAEVVNLQRELRDRSIELVMWRTRTRIPDEHMNSEVLVNDRSLVVAGLSNKWVRQKRIKLAELLEEPWILPPSDSAAGLSIDNAFRFGGHSVPRTAVSSTSMAMTMSLLAGGRFLSLLPETMIRLSAQCTTIKVLPVKLPASPRLITVVTLKHRTLSPAATLFIECAREVAKSMAGNSADHAAHRRKTKVS
jgi:DNA-binding transcriptional LysR family regulator